MRLYQMIFEVADDFVPEEANVIFQTDSDVAVVCEGFVGDRYQTPICDEDDQIEDAEVGPVDESEEAGEEAEEEEAE